VVVGDRENLLFLSKYNSSMFSAKYDAYNVLTATTLTCVRAPKPPTRLNVQVFMVSMIVVGDISEIYYGRLSTGQSQPLKRANKDHLDIYLSHRRGESSEGHCCRFLRCTLRQSGSDQQSAR
jgi:hypothetical protein